MALTAPVLEQTYRYPFLSAVVGEGDRRRLRLATSGGPTANPEFFRGRLLLPIVAADLLLTLGDVARSRFHVPSGMLIRILELADPVATCADDRLRFEAFSACCSVYGRVDLLPEAYEGETIGRGTTNVDFGPGIRSALASIEDRSRLGLALGADAMEVQADGGRPSSDASRSRRDGCAGSSRSRRSRLSWQRRRTPMLRARALSSGRSRRLHRNGLSGSHRPVGACGPFTTIRVTVPSLWPVSHASACSIASPATRRRSGCSRRPGTAAPAGSSMFPVPG